jgi:integrase
MGMQNTVVYPLQISPTRNHKNSHGASRAISMAKLSELKAMVRRDGDIRLLTIIALGSLTLRIGDILALRAGDLYGPDWFPMEVLKLVEMKTKKRRLIPLSGIRALLIEFAEGLNKNPMREDSALFVSLKQKRRLSRTSVNRMLAGYAERLQLPQLSPHSLRKGSARHLVIDKGWSIAVVQTLLAHSSEKITSRYLDINSQDVEAAFKDLIV